MKPSWLLGPLCLATVAAGAFEGMGKPWSEPSCAWACRAVVGPANLSCTLFDQIETSGHGHGPPVPKTEPSCRASDNSFLTTLAFCMESRCTGVAVGLLEHYWANQATGDPHVPAKWNYATTLQQINGDPNTTWESGLILNSTMLVSQTSWNVQNRFIPIMESNSYVMYKYSIILLIVGFATPIATTLLSKLPLISTLVEKVNPYLIFPSTIGVYQVRPLPWLLGNAPTLGQAWYIGGFIILNIILTCVDYKLLFPLEHPWGYNHRGEILAYAGYRTGEFAFALLPLTILFAGRNNVLLWLTNWSHSTYLLLHRWIARLFALHTILHSVLLLAARIQSGTYSEDKEMPYWIWGIAGTVFVSFMVVFSLLWMRRLNYEVFLLGHITMAVVTIVASWYHLVLRFGTPGSHEYWLYAAFAVWGFDRLLRLFRIARNGFRTATVTKVGATHVRIDIPGIRFSGKPSYHGYVYFPTVNSLRPWENHPFSVNSSALLHSFKHRLRSPDNAPGGHPSEDDKNEAKVETYAPDDLKTTAGVTLYVRNSGDMTRRLQKQTKLLTLLDGPYPNNDANPVLSCDRLLLIGGGIGVTGLLGFLTHVNVKLAWSVKQSDEPIAQDLEPVLHSIADKDIRIGERLDVEALLRREAQDGYKKVGVVVCGPGALCDDVRAIVARLGRHEKTIFELEVDAFSW